MSMSKFSFETFGGLNIGKRQLSFRLKMLAFDSDPRSHTKILNLPPFTLSRRKALPRHTTGSRFSNTDRLGLVNVRFNTYTTCTYKIKSILNFYVTVCNVDGISNVLPTNDDERNLNLSKFAGLYAFSHRPF